MVKRSVRGWLAVALFTAVALAACGGGAGTPVRITGKVLGDPPLLRDTTPAPVAAKVTCNGVTATAGKDGAYSLTVVQTDKYTCTADGGAGYAPRKATFGESLGRIIHLNFQATSQDACSTLASQGEVQCPTLAARGGTVKGAVTYGKGGMAVAQARVVCANTGDVAAGVDPAYVWPDATTDASGAFSVQTARVGPVACVAYAPSGDAQRLEAQVQPGTTATLNFSVCDRPCHPVHYHGGPVMHAFNAYLIFWLPSGRTYEPGGSDAHFEGLVQRYLRDVNGSAFYGLLAQYWDYQGAPSNAVRVAGVWVDTSAYQHCNFARTQCAPAQATTGDPLTDNDIQAEVAKAIASRPGWAAGPDNAFVVLTAAGAQECQRQGTTSSGCTFSNRDHDGFCGYHSIIGTAGGQAATRAVYIYLPSVTDNGGGCNLPDYVTGPNNDNVADATLTILSHEQFEAVSDPDTNAGWFDDSASLKREGEIGDKCVTALGSLRADNSNITLNGHPYLLQEEWSDAAGGCAFS